MTVGFEEVRQALAALSAENTRREGTTVRFLAAPLPPAPTHRIARDQDGTAVFLFRVGPSPAHERPAPIVLRRLAAEFDVACRLSRTDGGTETGLFAVVRCLSTDRYHTDFFLRLGLLLLQSLPAAPRSRDVAHLVDALADLLRAAAEPAQETLLGFWAELLLIARSPKPLVLLDAWRNDRYATFDFGADDERVEVKCGIGRVRRHHFSLEQARPAKELHVVFASLLTEPSSSGPSVRDLLEHVRQLAGQDSTRALRVERILVATLGESALTPLDEQFDEQLALSSLMFFQAGDIPAPGPDLPPAVSQVSFWADLSQVAPAPVDREVTTSLVRACVISRRKSATTSPAHSTGELAPKPRGGRRGKAEGR